MRLRMLESSAEKARVVFDSQALILARFVTHLRARYLIGKPSQVLLHLKLEFRKPLLKPSKHLESVLARILKEHIRNALDEATSGRGTNGSAADGHCLVVSVFRTCQL
jgi:hypothetical protein